MERSEDECRSFLEAVLWGDTPQCPYCQSINSTAITKERRYHCNTCFNSYSVTVGTMFHGTRVPLSKWFKAIAILLDEDPSISVRKLAQAIDVNKNTAAEIIRHTQGAHLKNPLLLKVIIDFIKSTG
ncbi:MAG: IS1595 family transposase [Leptolyngbya sp. DLM2.Bin15]|nr:MAG: IS1595 family transposase [Leptolyngbya sp. DLM2.Bin15]